MNSIINYFRSVSGRLSAVLLGVSLVLFGAAGTAGATHIDVPADPTGGALGESQTLLETWVTSYGIPFLFGLLMLGVLIRLGVKWLRRGAARI